MDQCPFCQGPLRFRETRCGGRLNQLESRHQVTVAHHARCFRCRVMFQWEQQVLVIKLQPSTTESVSST